MAERTCQLQSLRHIVTLVVSLVEDGAALIGDCRRCRRLGDIMSDNGLRLTYFRPLLTYEVAVRYLNGRSDVSHAAISNVSVPMSFGRHFSPGDQDR